jgi:hypothetical protein
VGRKFALGSRKGGQQGIIKTVRGLAAFLLYAQSLLLLTVSAAHYNDVDLYLQRETFLTDRKPI